MPEWSCSKGGERGNPYGPIFDEATCQSMQSKVGACQRLTEYCYKMPSRFVRCLLFSAPYEIFD